MKQWVYKGNIVWLLRNLSDKDYQTRIWLNRDNPDNLVASFVETVNMLFDDCIIGDLLEENEIIFDRAVTRVLRELDDAVDVVASRRREEEIINDPLMQVVREKAAEALALILASDYSESTVDIVEEA